MTDAHARGDQPVADNIVQFRARADAPLSKSRATSKKALAPIWESDPISITMALSLCNGNIGRASALLASWQDEATLIGRSVKR